MAELIESSARQAGATIAGRIRYDRSVTRAQMEGKSVVELDAPCTEGIRHIWHTLGMGG